MILETAAAVVSAAKPLVKPFVEKYVTSKLQSFAEWCKQQGKKVMIPKSEHFKLYLERMYDKCSIVKTMAFSTSQLKLKDIYVPLTLVKKNRIIDDKEPTVIDDVPSQLIKKYKKILITDTAGMGKSTVLKRMFIALIDNVQENLGIPIYIELNKLNIKHTIVKEIQDELKTLSKAFDNELLFDFIQTGGFVFFLDGYDEISENKDLVTKDIQDFISKAGEDNYYFLTSRPDESSDSFGDFQSFSIQPLKKEEAFELLKKYDLSENKVVSKNLIATLNSGRYSTIQEYLGNPLLVSLLYTAYNYRQTVPLKKCQFYRQVYDALFEAHKLVQGVKPHKKNSLSDIDDFNRVLRYVGYECLTKNGVRFDKDTILSSIEKAKAFYGNLEFGSSGFLKDLVTTVPLFFQDGTEYTWAHKSLMEYFAAQFIAIDAKEEQDSILSAIYKSKNVSKYGNMLDIYYDIDYKGFSKNITLPLCESYVEFYDSIQIENPIINQELISIRKSLLFLGDFIVQYGEIDGSLGMNLDFSLAITTHTLTPFEFNPWIKFCSCLLYEKKRSSLSFGYAILEKMRRDLLHELEHVVNITEDEVYRNRDVEYRPININISPYGECIMVRDKKLGVSIMFKVCDRQIVLKDAGFYGDYGSCFPSIRMTIDSHTGEKHPLLYNAFNISIMHSLMYEYNYYSDYHWHILDYEACKREIESVQRILSQSVKKSNLLDGI